MERFAVHHHQHDTRWEKNNAPDDYESHHHDPEPGAGAHRGYRRHERDRDRQFNASSKRHYMEEQRGHNHKRNDGWEHDKYDGSDYRHSSRSREDDYYDSDRERYRRDRRYEKYGRAQHSNSHGSGDDLHDDSRSPYADRHSQEFPQQTEQLPVVPSGTLVVKGLSQKTVEDDLYRALGAWGPLKHVRVIKEKATGASRGFAFIDFPSVDAAEQLMQAISDDGVIVNGRRVYFEYSRPTGGAFSDHRFFAPGLATDWICAICGYLNFARRVVCLQCNESRGEEAGDLGQREPAAPSNVLAIRGLEENIDEEILHYEFSKYAPIKDLRLIRDKFTHVSRGYAFIHYSSVEDATKALEATNNTAIDKSGQVLRVTFAKSPYGLHGGPPPNGRPSSAIGPTASAQQYDAAGWEPKEYDSRQQQEGNEQGISQGFVWDEASGYYYDAATKFYYDPNRNLYYDGNSGIWYTYDQELQKYEPYMDSSTVQENTPKHTQENIPKPAQKKARPNAVISAPAVHNDVSEKNPSPEPPTIKKEKEKKEFRISLKNPGSNKKKMANAFNLWKQRQNEDYVPEPTGDEDVNRGRQNTNGKVRNADIREPEVASKAENWNSTHGPSRKRRFTEAAPQQVYRDRAAERRSLYGLSVPGSEEMEQMAVHEAPVNGGGSDSYEVIRTDRAIDEKNIGNRMLRNMGWQEGSGLGRGGTGIVEPVQAQRGSERAGLGSHKKLDERFEAQPGDSYRAIIQKKSYARFHDML